MNEEVVSPASVPSSGVTQETVQERERSTIAFPYLSLDVAVEIVKAVHATGGQQSQSDQVAAHLGESANSGAFRNKIITTRLFGLARYSTGTVTLTSLGSRITDPDQEKAARAEAFLSVPLYKRLFDDFRGVVLPPTASALEAVMVSMGVAPKQKDKARQAFQRSAQQAGFFAYGATKLVYPSLTGAAPPANRSADEPSERESSGGDRANAKVMGNADVGGQYHPFIQGLLQTLPEPKTDWPLAARKKWLQSALSIFDVIYDSQDDDQNLAIRLERNAGP